jgi:hypothetical protein
MGDLSTSADQARIEQASAHAVAHETIVALPHGYATLLDRGWPGERASAGSVSASPRPGCFFCHRPSAELPLVLAQAATVCSTL